MLRETNTAARLLCAVWLTLPRGTVAKMCEETSISKSDMSNWWAGRRDITAEKYLIMQAWLLDKGYITMEGRV